MSGDDPGSANAQGGGERSAREDGPTPGPARSSPKGYPGPMAYAGIGMLNAVCLLGGGALGWLVDRWAGTLPLFLLIGLLAGAAAGVAGTRGELRRYDR
ncbi:MAG TPA: AtpZ/AtpI family protein [Acidimicrobiales bacterium]|nr:AtpZ/AtpI family protein [Acidimicrobiales bacterium]